MNGDNALFDTSALIYFFEGRAEAKRKMTETGIVHYSIISQIELLSHKLLDAKTEKAIIQFLGSCEKIGLSDEIALMASKLRRKHGLKTPDAIIAASALCRGLPVVTADADFRKVDKLIVNVIKP